MRPLLQSLSRSDARRLLPASAALVSLIFFFAVLLVWLSALVGVHRTQIGVALVLRRADLMDESFQQDAVLFALDTQADLGVRLLGFVYWRGDVNGLVTSVLFVPYWFLLLLTATAPAWWWHSRRRRRRRLKDGLCHQCGYDLRASQDRCPECGTAIPPRANAEGASA